MARFVRYAVRLALVAVVAWLGWMSRAWAQDGPHRAGLVVRFGDGTVETRCVSFAGPAISGAELLARAGLSAIVDYNGGMGGAVCSIKGQGCAFPREDCFCKCQGSTCEYWAYYHWQDGRWLYSDVGASSFQVTDGAIEGWSWGKGNFSSGTEPPVIRFEEICAASAVAGGAGGNTVAMSAPAAPATAEQIAPRPDAETSARSRPPATGTTRYASFALFAAALAGGWVWIWTRRRRAATASAVGRKA